MKEQPIGGRNGNHTRFDKKREVTPLYTMYPLTSYPKDEHGDVTDLDISDEDVIRLRDFDIENKK